ncbi:hypothetical protein Pla175_43380 [Pirellulimonas nuda]|uniref:Autotransporter-associated beta strand repeat protein n=1 Tax=Pirellulimonas nuda TaxID=2528009 RepID=A0A518DHH9_9BACT|nr:hypothetical protein [Pirellulimonas nuda]QDU90924.1 hypothetical protein Pla175_43380 [Pirellulimonas nuda]
MSICRHNLLLSVGIVLLISLSPRSASAVTVEWDGGDAGNLFSANANWVDEVAGFTDGDDVVFGALATGTATPDLAATVNSITFTDGADANITVNAANPAWKLGAGGVTVGADAAGTLMLAGQMQLLSASTTMTNNATVRFQLNQRIDDNGGSELVLTGGGGFAMNGGSPPNSAFSGGLTIVDSSLVVNATIPTDASFTRGPLGIGAVTLGTPGSTAASELRLASGAVAQRIVKNEINVTSGDGARILRSFNVNAFYNGPITGAGELTFADGLQILNNTNLDSTFNGRAILSNTALQVRANKAFGDTATIVQLGNVAATATGVLRPFLDVDGGAIVIDNPIEFYAGNLGVQGASTIASFSADFNGDITIKSAEQVDVIAQINTGVAQGATLNLGGDISGGDAASVVRFVGGQQTGAAGSLQAGSSAEVNLSGANTYLNSTQIDGAQFQGSDLLTVNLSGSLDNSNITITDNALMKGTGGTLAYNISGSTADLITVDGTLDITGLTLDLNIASPSQSSYVVADFAGGSLVGNAFANVIDLPVGASLSVSGTQITLDGLTVSAGTPGDYNNDGVVDAADYTVWRDNLNTSNALPNDGGLGAPVTSAYYDQWKNNFGQPASGAIAAGSAVPEPGTLALGVLVFLVCSTAVRPHRA